jgi:hypothetical protein
MKDLFIFMKTMSRVISILGNQKDLPVRKKSVKVSGRKSDMTGSQALI